MKTLKLTMQRYEEYFWKNLWHDCKEVLTAVLFMVLMGGLFIVTAIYIVILISPLLIERYQAEILIVKSHHKLSLLIFAGVACALFILRRMSMTAFAYLEISSAVVLASTAIRTPYLQNIVFWAALITALYLAVRGLETWRQHAETKRQNNRASFTGSSKSGFAGAVSKSIESLYRYQAQEYSRIPWPRKTPRRYYHEAESCTVELTLEFEEYGTSYVSKMFVRSRRLVIKDERSDQKYAAIGLEDD